MRGPGRLLLEEECRYPASLDRGPERRGPRPPSFEPFGAWALRPRGRLPPREATRRGGEASWPVRQKPGSTSGNSGSADSMPRHRCGAAPAERRTIGPAAAGSGRSRCQPTSRKVSLTAPRAARRSSSSQATSSNSAARRAPLPRNRDSAARRLRSSRSRFEHRDRARRMSPATRLPLGRPGVGGRAKMAPPPLPLRFDRRALCVRRCRLGAAPGSPRAVATKAGLDVAFEIQAATADGAAEARAAARARRTRASRA